MRSTFLKGSLIVAMGVLLVACGDTNPSNEEKIHIEQSDNHEHADSHEHNHEHNHDHDHDHEHKEGEADKIYKGFFEDSQVEHRSLSDWDGNWQSVYPYLIDGTLDEVFTHKANTTGKMSAAEYKDYYAIGYKTDTEHIIIDGNTVTFINNGVSAIGEYEQDGYEILTYEAGNRGVRYIFKQVNEKENLPKYIQFSDHHIAPYKVDHFHLYWGNDRAALLEEVVNWPTYYPSNLDGKSIANEMMLH